MRLPPPGSDPAAIAEYVNLIRMENYQDARRQRWVSDKRRGIDLYLGDHFSPSTPNPTLAVEGAQIPSSTEAGEAEQATLGMVRVVLNRVGNCIISLMAIQAGDLPSIKFTPRETGETPIYYLNSNLPEAQVIEPQLQSDSLVAGVSGNFGDANPTQAWDPSQPLPDAEVQKLKAMIAQGEQLKALASMQGLPTPQGIMPPEILVEVSDRTCAEALQTVFDAMWESCDAQYYFAENVLNKNIMGWQPTVYEFDDENKQHILSNPDPEFFFIDHTRSDFRRNAYTIYDEPIGADEAKSLYPNIDPDKIDEIATGGQIQQAGNRTYAPPPQFVQNFYRDMLYVTHVWFRYQPYPMDPQEAIESGSLISQEVVEDPDDQGAGGMEQDESQVTPATLPPTRLALIHPDSNQEITPTIPGPDGKPQHHPQWPMRHAIRQIMIVGNNVVDDRECFFDRIPVSVNTNIPVPFSPYAQGEPVRLEGIQMAINYVLSAIITHQRYNAVPPEYMPESVLARMEGAMKTARTKPGQRIAIPDDLLTLFGDIKKIVMLGETAAIPPDFWKLLQFLVEIIDKEGNQSDVMNGNASPSWSGDAIASLQNAASQVIKAKAIMSEFYLRDQARLMCASIIRRMEPKDWMRYLSKFPWQALQALHGKAKGLQFDISIQITGGSGANKKAQTNALIGAKQMGVPVSDPTMMERLDLDPDVELTQQADFDRKRAAAMPQVQQDTQQPGQGGARNPAPQNGKGQPAGRGAASSG